MSSSCLGVYNLLKDDMHISSRTYQVINTANVLDTSGWKFELVKGPSNKRFRAPAQLQCGIVDTDKELQISTSSSMGKEFLPIIDASCKWSITTYSPDMSVTE